MSARLQYRVGDLRKQIHARADQRIEAEIEKYQDNMDLAARRADWRAEVEKRFHDMHYSLNSRQVSDTELTSFYLPPLPVISVRYSRTPEESRDEEIKKINDSRERRLGRLDAMITQDDNSLWLTTTMLNDLFGL